MGPGEVATDYARCGGRFARGTDRNPAPRWRIGSPAGPLVAAATEPDHMHVTPSFLLASWETLGQVALAAILVYIVLVVLLRVSGKRTLAKFNAFDFVVTVALGSMVAATILNDEITVAAGAVGIATLVLAQMVVSYGLVRIRGAHRLIKSTPRIVYYRGAFDRKAMLAERVSSEEIRQAVRQAGHARMDEVLAVILESDGRLNVISAGAAEPFDSLATVQGADGNLPAGEHLPPAGTWENSHVRPETSSDDRP
jgi:uncharacterized membrane protein YcaP (DUF421 family)